MPRITLVLALACVAVAQEPFADIDGQLVAAVEKADAAVVIVRPHGLPGVLVGTPARLVVPIGLVADAARIEYEAGGALRRATRIDADDELGLAVYSPEGESAAGLEPESVEALRRGRLALSLGGGVLRLVPVSDFDRGTYTMRMDADAGGVLVSTRGRLLALRGGAGQSCTACHDSGVRQPTTDFRIQHGFLTPPSRAGGTRNWVTLERPAYAADRFGNVYAWGDTNEASALVPAPVIARVVEDIAQHGRIRRGYLGVIPGETKGDGSSVGLVLASVLVDSPAAKAGLKGGEVVTAVDGTPCHDAATFARLLALRRPGDAVALRVGGKEFTVTLADRVDAQSTLVTPEMLGMECVDLVPELRTFLALPEETRGAVVQSVQRGGTAARGGVRRGDVIVTGGGGPIRDMRELRAAFAASKAPVELEVLRDGSRVSLTLPLPAPRAATGR